MRDCETVEVREGDVIVIRSDEVGSMDDKVLNTFIAELHEHHPKSLVVILPKDDTFETMPLDTLQRMLEDVIEHKSAMRS